MDLRSWVSDNTIKFLGAVDSTVVDYIIAEAQSAKNPDVLHNKLADVGFPSGPDGKSFAANLYIKVPRKRKHELTAATKKSKQKETATLLKQSSSYKLLLDPEEETAPVPPPKDKKDKKEKKSKARRKVDGDEQWQSDEEDKRVRKRRREEYEEEQRAKYEATMDPELQEELNRQDERERDEFAAKMKQKDQEERTVQSHYLTADGKVVEDRSLEARNRRHLADDATARAAALPNLRIESRQQYLGKRQAQQIELLRMQVREDEIMFANEKLTKREIEEMNQRKAALRIAEERQKIDDGVDAYAMPDEYFTKQGKIDRKRREEVLTKRYHDQKHEKYITDGDQWEQYQTKVATSQIAKSNRAPPPDQYEYVFDESQNVSFLMGDQIAGSSSAEHRELERRLKEVEEKVAGIDAVRKSLPVFAYRNELIKAVHDHQVLIIVGSTGSGKTTQIPQYLYEAGFSRGDKIIGCTQPRRVAAMSVAARVSEEMGTRLGNEVGYTIRFEDVTTPGKTVIKYMTDGMLLRQILSEPGLDSYSVMMIDEAHERNLATDILLGLLKDISRWRPDLKILVSSATLDAQKFSEFFDDAPIFNIPGRKYQVNVFYTESPESNYITAVLSTVFQIHISQPPGDILVFLTGQEEIEACAENLQETCRKLGSKIPEMIIAPIYANLPADQQAKIFEPTPSNARKVILSTNIAESSITVDQVAYVIDTGFVKENHFNPRTGIESLLISPISQASAVQRAGRAGRTGPGNCFRLYTKWAYMNELPESTTPEIQRTNLSNTVLTLKSLRINNLLEFPFVDAPHPETLMRALELLYALRDDGELTKLGRQMAEIPLDPKASKCIIAAGKLGCVEEVLSILAMLQEGPAIFYRPKQQMLEADTRHANFSRGDVGDHIALLNIWNEFVESEYSWSWARENYLQIKSLNRVRDVRDQLARLCERIEVDLSSSSDHIAIKKAITAGYFFNVGRLDRSGESYHVAKNGGQQLYIHPSSSMFHVKPPPKFILYNELVLTSKEYARNVMEIRPEWLKEAAPHYYDKSVYEKKMLPRGQGKVASKI